MDRLTSMSVFVKVVDLGSFAAAAKELRLSPPMIGKHIRFLEERLGSQLINRSTRRQNLTELGRDYLDHCRHLLEEAEAGDALAEEALREPHGKLRIATSLAFGSYCLTPAVVQFMKKYPEASIELVLSDRMTDLLKESIDAAIRFGTLTDSTMMSRSLSPYTGVICAAPSYLAERGIPKHPTDWSITNAFAIRAGMMDRDGLYRDQKVKFRSLSAAVSASTVHLVCDMLRWQVPALCCSVTRYLQTISLQAACKSCCPTTRSRSARARFFGPRTAR